MECREAVFAAWIINISRFCDEGAKGLVERCAALLENYLDIEKVLGILQKREECEEMWKVADAAFWLSLCESEEKEKLAKGKNLTSVFSRVTVKDQVQQKKMYYPIKKSRQRRYFPGKTWEMRRERNCQPSFWKSCLR